MVFSYADNRWGVVGVGFGACVVFCVVSLVVLAVVPGGKFVIFAVCDRGSVVLTWI